MTKNADLGARSAAQRLEGLGGLGATPEAIARDLDAVEHGSLSHRRRLQAEILGRSLADLAELASRCGWDGKAILEHGRVLIERGGVVLNAEPAIFRSFGRSPAASIDRTITGLGLRPRTILDLAPESGEAAIGLALRYPRARVVVAHPSPERIEVVESNLALQPRPPPNLELARLGSDKHASGDTLQRLCSDRAIRGIDLLNFEAGPESAALAASLRAVGLPVQAALGTFKSAAHGHAELLAALQSAGLVMLEKGSQPIADASAWLAGRLAERPVVTAWFIARRRQPSSAGAAAISRTVHGVARALAHPRTGLWGLLRAFPLRSASDDKRFELEQLYAARSDPWFYTSNPYEVLKYRRTLETARRLRPQAEAVLEIGCSIGVFTRMLALAFPEVTAVDVASEALKHARRRVGKLGRVSWVRADIRRLRLPGRFDLIFCAEMLYYLPLSAAPEVRQSLEECLAPGGAVIMVMPKAGAGAAVDLAEEWSRILRGAFRLASREDFEDPVRPYTLQVFERGGPAA